MKPTLHPMVLGLYGLACLKHAGQTRRDGETPYIEHIHDVLRISKTKDALRQAVIIGHDLFEDRPDTTEDEVRATLAGFKPDDIDLIIGCINELTKRPDEDYPTFMARLRRSPYGALVHDTKRWDMAANIADSPSRKQLIKYGNGLVALFS